MDKDNKTGSSLFDGKQWAPFLPMLHLFWSVMPEKKKEKQRAGTWHWLCRPEREEVAPPRGEAPQKAVGAQQKMLPTNTFSLDFVTPTMAPGWQSHHQECAHCAKPAKLAGFQGFFRFFDQLVSILCKPTPVPWGVGHVDEALLLQHTESLPSLGSSTKMLRNYPTTTTTTTKMTPKVVFPNLITVHL